MRTWVALVKWKDGNEVCYGPFVSREVANMLQFAGFAGGRVERVTVYEIEQP